MSRLQETMWGDIPGWQWDSGPIFVGVDGRRLAVEYGKAVQRLEDLDGIANLCQQRVMRLGRLKKLQQTEEQS